MSLNKDFFNGEPIALGSCDLYISDDNGVTLPEVGIFGQTTTSTTLNYEEQWEDVKSKNDEEPVDIILKSHKATVKFTLDKIINKNVISEFSTGLVDESGVLKAKRSLVGTAAKKYYVRFHPKEMGNDTSLDVVLPNCAFKTKLAWSGKLSEMLNMEFEGVGFYPKTDGGKIEIGAPKLTQA